MTDSERLDKLNAMVSSRYGLSKLLSMDGHRTTDVRSIIDEATPELDSYASPEESARIIRFQFTPETGTEASVHYPGIVCFACEIAQMFRDSGAVNVLEVELIPPDMEKLTLTIQRAGHKTPMALRAEALKALETERALRVSLQAQIGNEAAV